MLSLVIFISYDMYHTFFSIIHSTTILYYVPSTFLAAKDTAMKTQPKPRASWSLHPSGRDRKSRSK